MLHQRARAEKRERSVAHVEFRSLGAAVEIDQICFGLAPAPSFLWAICSIPLFGIAKFAAARFGLAIPAKIPATWTAAVSFCLNFQFVATAFRENPESNQRLKLLLSLVFFTWRPWPAVAYSHNHLNFYPQMAADTSRNTSKMTRGIGSQK